MTSFETKEIKCAWNDVVCNKLILLVFENYKKSRKLGPGEKAVFFLPEHGNVDT